MTTQASEIQHAGVGGRPDPAANGRAGTDPTVSFLLILGGAFVALRFFAAIWRVAKSRGKPLGKHE